MKFIPIYNEMKLKYSEQERVYCEEHLTNSLLTSMFSRRNECGDEVTEYLQIEEIGFFVQKCKLISNFIEDDMQILVPVVLCRLYDLDQNFKKKIIIKMYFKYFK